MRSEPPRPEHAGALSRSEGAGALAQIGRAERCRVAPLGAAPAWASWWRRQLAPGAGVSHYLGSPLHLTRRAADIALRPADRLTLVVHASPGAVLWQAGVWRRIDAGELTLLDAGEPYDLRAPAGASSAVHVTRSALRLPGDRLRAAASRLATSPLHDLVRDHVRALGALGAGVEPPAAVGPRTDDDLVAATVALVAALLLSAGGPP